MHFGKYFDRKNFDINIRKGYVETIILEKSYNKIILNPDKTTLITCAPTTQGYN